MNMRTTITSTRNLRPQVVEAREGGVTGPRGIQMPVWTGHVELTIGEVEDEWPYLFEDVEAIATGEHGRIFVGDSGAQTVRVYGPDGQFLFPVGRPGRGPGEFNASQICHLTFDSEGLLWVNARDAYKIFDVRGDRARFMREVRPPEYSTLCVPPIFEGTTGLTLIIPATPRGVQHVQLSPDGEVVSRQVVTVRRTWKELGWLVAHLDHPSRGRVERIVQPPFASWSIATYASDGRFAHVVTSEYRVQLFESNGSMRGEIRNDARGPLVTRREVEDERARLRRAWESLRRFNVRVPDYEMPERKPPVGNIWYDRDDRLWVLNSPAEGDRMLKAEVYDPGGHVLFVAQWPRDIDLSVGDIGGYVAVGVQRLAFDVQRVVRLRFTRLDR